MAGSQGHCIDLIVPALFAFVTLEAEIQLYLLVILPQQIQCSNFLVLTGKVKSSLDVIAIDIYVFQCTCNECWIVNQSPIRHV